MPPLIPSQDSELTDTQSQSDLTLVSQTSEIVAAYVTFNTLGSAELPRLIADVHRALAGLANAPANPEAEAPQPAVSIRKSVTPDFLICLDDGMKFKSLKRHLTQLGMTPQEYRDKWKLPHDYPMVAPNYSETRSALAKNLGLGRKAAQVVAKKRALRAKTTTA